jgi:hypothetical protein
VYHRDEKVNDYRYELSRCLSDLEDMDTGGEHAEGLRGIYNSRAAEIASCLDLRGLYLVSDHAHLPDEIVDTNGSVLVLDCGARILIGAALDEGRLSTPGDLRSGDGLSTVRALRFAFDLEEVVEKRARPPSPPWMRLRKALAERDAADARAVASRRAAWPRRTKFDPPFVVDASPSDGSDEHLDFMREGFALTEAIIRAERAPASAAPPLPPWRTKVPVEQVAGEAPSHDDPLGCLGGGR